MNKRLGEAQSSRVGEWEVLGTGCTDAWGLVSGCEGPQQAASENL